MIPFLKVLQQLPVLLPGHPSFLGWLRGSSGAGPCLRLRPRVLPAACAAPAHRQLGYGGTHISRMPFSLRFQVRAGQSELVQNLGDKSEAAAITL